MKLFCQQHFKLSNRTFPSPFFKIYHYFTNWNYLYPTNTFYYHSLFTPFIIQVTYSFLPHNNEKQNKTYFHFSRLHDYILNTINMSKYFIFFNGISPSHLLLRKTSTSDPVCQKFLAGTVQAKSRFCYGPSLWNTLQPNVRLASILLLFRKSLKTWFCQLGWSRARAALCWGWLTGQRDDPTPYCQSLWFSLFKYFVILIFLYYILSICNPLRVTAAVGWVAHKSNKINIAR